MNLRPATLLSFVFALVTAACSSPVDAPLLDAGGAGGAAADAGTDADGAIPADPRCAIPPGASDLIQVATPAEGLTCLRYPFPLASPRDVVETTGGTIYVTEFGAGRIVALTEGGFSPIAGGLAAPIGLREADDGSLLVTEESALSLSRIDPTTGTRAEIAGNLHNVTYLARGPDGAAYVSSFEDLADTKKGIVHRVDIATGAATPFATGLNVPEGLFLDEAGALFVAEWLLPSMVYRFPQGGGAIETASPIADGFQNVYGLVGDGAGGLYAGDHAGRVVHIAEDGTRSDVVTGIGRPGGLWRTKEGDLLIAEFVDFGQTGYLIRISGF